MDFDQFVRKAEGCIVGQAIGDALGAPVEGMTPTTIREKLGGALTDFVSTSPAGTDDTEYAVLNALILLEYGTDVTEADVYTAWQKWLIAPDSGFKRGGFSDAIAMINLREGLRSPHSGRFGQQHWSDGLAMAVGPVGVACSGDPQKAAWVTAQIGSISNGRDGIHAGQAVAAGVATAMTSNATSATTSATVDDVLHSAMTYIPADSWTRRLLERAANIALRSNSVWDAHEVLYKECALSYFPWTDIAPEAVALAFGAFIAAKGNYKESVLGGINLGRDADTIGAMAGALAGAYRGIDEVPGEWRAKITSVRGSNFKIVANINLAELAHRLADKFSKAS
jgi:ADP-ribosylglycohydrolase